MRVQRPTTVSVRLDSSSATRMGANKAGASAGTGGVVGGSASSTAQLTSSRPRVAAAMTGFWPARQPRCAPQARAPISNGANRAKPAGIWPLRTSSMCPVLKCTGHHKARLISSTPATSSGRRARVAVVCACCSEAAAKASSVPLAKVAAP